MADQLVLLNYFFTTIILLLTPIAVIGNTVSFRVMLRLPAQGVITKLFALLAIFDVINVILLCLHFTVIPLVLSQMSDLIVSHSWLPSFLDYFCKIFLFAMGVSYSCSVLMLTSVTLIRLYCILRPLDYYAMNSYRVPTRIAMVCLAISAVPVIPPIIATG